MCDLVRSLWEIVWRFLNLKTEVLYDVAISLLGLGICPKRMKPLSQKDVCTPAFISAAFTRATASKRPKGSRMDECIKDGGADTPWNTIQP